MSDYFDCTKVGVDFLEQTKNVIVSRQIIQATPDQIFDVFEDAHAWTEWALPIEKVVWTSPKPFAVGTTRNVHMMGNLIGYEEFVEWHRGKRMAFSFVGSNKNVTSKFLEDYRVSYIGKGNCKVEWYMAMEVNGFSRHMMFLTRPIMRIANRAMFKKFKKYVEAYATGQVSLGAS